METKRLLILYATETGNAQSLAERTAETARAKGFAVECQNCDEYDFADLQNEPALVFFGSTYGEGEPPETAWDFYDAMQDAADNTLDHMHYAVVGLGDSSFGNLYNAFGRKVEKEMKRLGAKPILPRVDCDIDFAKAYTPWAEQFFATVSVG